MHFRKKKEEESVTEQRHSHGEQASTDVEDNDDETFDMRGPNEIGGATFLMIATGGKHHDWRPTGSGASNGINPFPIWRPVMCKRAPPTGALRPPVNQPRISGNRLWLFCTTYWGETAWFLERHKEGHQGIGGR